MTQRSVVITGSAGGIGTAISSRFAQDGDIVVGLDLADGFDLSQPQQCHDTIERVVAEHGRIDVLCNNAGISSVGDVVDSTLNDWQRVFAVNVFGIANMSRAVLPHMRKQGSGFIVNTCSIAATVGLVERAVYSASKGAVLSLTKAMAADEIAHNIRVNCVCPGFIQTPMVQAVPDKVQAQIQQKIALGKFGQPEDVANLILFLASCERAGYITGEAMECSGLISL
jgi:NAD(P)-dependent dehydrogenase (short-subunit alcohol dehydrogenase family)